MTVRVHSGPSRREVRGVSYPGPCSVRRAPRSLRMIFLLPFRANTKADNSKFFNEFCSSVRRGFEQLIYHWLCAAHAIYLLHYFVTREQPHWGQTICGSMVDIQSPTAKIRQGKKGQKIEETTGQKYNGLPYYIGRP